MIVIGNCDQLGIVGGQAISELISYRSFPTAVVFCTNIGIGFQS